MPATSLTISANNTQISAKTDAKDDKSLRVTGKVRVAVEAMVWNGLPRAKAAEYAGMTEHGLYKALRKPPVKAYYLQELDVLRTSERARNIHALVEVRDQPTNQMARVNAVKALEQISDEQDRNPAATAAPGLAIVVIQATVPAASGPQPSDIKTIEGESV